MEEGQYTQSLQRLKKAYLLKTQLLTNEKSPEILRILNSIEKLEKLIENDERNQEIRENMFLQQRPQQRNSVFEVLNQMDREREERGEMEGLRDNRNIPSLSRSSLYNRAHNSVFGSKILNTLKMGNKGDRGEGGDGYNAGGNGGNGGWNDGRFDPRMLDQDRTKKKPYL